MTVEIHGGLSPAAIAELLGAKLFGNSSAADAVTGVSTDSREVLKGGMFIAIRGENFDGHRFLSMAAEKGALCALVEYIPENAPDMCYIVVEDTLKALGYLAKSFKSALSPLTVAVTGSVGKTTTKEFIYGVLSQRYKTLKTEANHNNHIGLPMTLLSLEKDHRAAVLEMGMSNFGEISYLSRIGAPNIAVITNIGSSHIENLGSREGIRNAKLEIADGMSDNGILILNGDEPLLSGIDGAYYVSMTGRRAYANVSGIVTGENGMAFDITIGGETYESIVIPVLGEHNVLDAAYAYVIGKLIGMGDREIRDGLMSFQNVALRQEITKIGDYTVIKDCYNASYESMKASLKLLSDVCDNKKAGSVAVLGEMRELGDFSTVSHEKVGYEVARLGIDRLFTFGKLANDIKNGAVAAGMDESKIFSVEDLKDYSGLVQLILANTKGNEVMLFKASRAVALENSVEELNTKIKG